MRSLASLFNVPDVLDGSRSLAALRDDDLDRGWGEWRFFLEAGAFLMIKVFVTRRNIISFEFQSTGRSMQDLRY